MGRIIKRYESTIYGPYRVAYLRSGALTSLFLVGYVLVSRLLGAQVGTPESYGTDAVLLIATGLFMMIYRNSLPDQKVTFKELMLFGLGLVLTASVIYGLFLWLWCGVLYPEQADIFAETRIAAMPTPDEGGAEAAAAIDKVRHYSAFDWGFIGFFRSAVMGGLIAFFGAVLFRTEKGKVRSKTK
ncbi:MAG: DUF4199 domain-containing protein [Bacteroidales bacterium]|nr:DUF4199 domain-containing protein [Bacteroidales bacterium]